MDDHAGERGSTDLLRNQRNNDLHRYSSEGTPNNCANITNPARHGLSRCSRTLLNGIGTRLHSPTRRQLPNPSGSTNPLEKRPVTALPRKPLFFLQSKPALFSTVIYGVVGIADLTYPRLSENAYKLWFNWVLPSGRGPEPSLEFPNLGVGGQPGL